MRFGYVASIAAALCLNCISSTQPVMLVSPPRLDFGDVPFGQYADRTVTISNTGTGILSGALSSECGSYRLVNSLGDSVPGSFSLGAAQSTKFSVRYTPSIADTEDCAMATGTSIQPYLLVHGVGRANTECVVSPTTVDFGIVSAGSGVIKDFSITNTGSALMNGRLIIRSGDFGFSGSSFTLGQGQTQVVTLFLATNRPGHHDTVIETTVPGCGPIYVKAEIR